MEGNIDGSTKRVDHGASPEKPDAKRLKPGSPEPSKTSTKSRKSLPLHEDRCCSCTKASKCKTRKCECFRANRRCRNCDGSDKCCNREGVPFCVEFKSSASATDESSAKASSLKSTPKAPKEDKKKSGVTSPITVETVVEDEEDSRREIEDGGQVQSGEGPESEPEERCIGDLPGATISEVDRMLDEVYGDHVHQNPGTHLDGGISDDKLWQEHWSHLVVYPGQTYDAPSGSVGRRFTSLMADEWEGMLNRKWNSERVLLFGMVILQCNRGVKRSKDIKNRISKRLDAWEQGKFDMLVQETERDMKSLLSEKQRGTTFEQRAKIFHQKMLRGDVRGAVRYLTEREKGGIHMPDEIDEKTGDPVEEVLRSKHPDAKIADPSFLPKYDEVPDFVDLDITEDVVERVARKLSGSGGLGGSDAQAVSQLLLKFGTASRKLRIVMAKVGQWLANESPPWAAYRALMAGRLLAVDKCPGIRPIGVGETWR